MDNTDGFHAVDGNKRIQGHHLIRRGESGLWRNQTHHNTAPKIGTSKLTLVVMAGSNFCFWSRLQKTQGQWRPESLVALIKLSVHLLIKLNLNMFLLAKITYMGGTKLLPTPQVSRNSHLQVAWRSYKNLPHKSWQQYSRSIPISKKPCQPSIMHSMKS